METLWSVSSAELRQLPVSGDDLLSCERGVMVDR